MNKITNFFKKQKNTQESKVVDQNNENISSVNINGQDFKIPKEHVKSTTENTEDCPFIKAQKTKEQQSLDLEVPKPKKEKKPKGGCPFMPSEKKKNPGLMEDIQQQYNMKYISPMNYLFDCKGFNVNKKEYNKRANFDQFPIYLKMSLFHSENEQMLKARQCEMNQRFFVFDQFREKGNKLFRKQEFHASLNCYEHALSVIRWLEMVDEDSDEEDWKITKTKNNKEDEEFKENDQLIQKKSKIKKKASKEQIKKKNYQRVKEAFKGYAEEKENEEFAKENELLVKGNENSGKNSCDSDSDSDSEYDEDTFIETPEQTQARLKRQEEQQKRQEELFRKAQENVNQSSLPENENISNCGSLQKGARSYSSRGSAQISDASDNEDEDPIPVYNEEEKQIDNDKHSKDDNDSDWHSEASSTAAVGDDKDLQERHQEILKEQRQEERRQKKLEELINDENFDKNSETHISMDPSQDYDRKKKKAEQVLKDQDEEKEFNRKYRLWLTTFTDKNTVLKDGEDLIDSHEIDMRNGMLITVLLNLALVYQKLGHFENALEALSDAEKIAQCKSSQIYYRKCQIINNNTGSTLTQLQQAKHDIEFAIKVKQTEKLFNQESGIIKILNLQDHNEAYREQAIQVTDRIYKKRKEDTHLINQLVERCSEIEEIYQEMISDGRIVEGQKSELENYLDSRRTEFETEKELKLFDRLEYLDDIKEKQIVDIMVNKYYEMVDFYIQQKKEDQVSIAQKELQNILDVQYKMSFYYGLNFSPTTSDEIIIEVKNKYNLDFKSPKTQQRLEKLKIEYAKEIYIGAEFNFQILEYAIKEYYNKVFKLKQQLESMQKERTKKIKKVKGKQSIGGLLQDQVSNLFSMSGLFQIAFLLFILMMVLQFSGVKGNQINILQLLTGYFLTK